MGKRVGRVTLVALALLGVSPATAAADWYFTPFIGADLRASTTLVDLEYGGRNRTKVTFGGSAALLVGMFGIEADYAFVPRFFQNPVCREQPRDPARCVAEGLPIITDSHVQTLTGNVILAAPLALTRESLRPYLVAGIGWMDARSQDITNQFNIDANLTAFNVGGGAIGMFGSRTGLRFDLRRFTNLDRDVPSGQSIGGPARLHFWRGTVGLTLRY